MVNLQFIFIEFPIRGANFLSIKLNILSCFYDNQSQQSRFINHRYGHMIDHFILKLCDRASFVREVYTTNKQKRMFSKMIKTDYDIYLCSNMRAVIGQ